MRCPVDDVVRLEKLLNLFFGYERAEITEFRKAVEQFKTDLPAVLEALREMIEKAQKAERPFAAAAKRFLDHAHEAINPTLTEADVREMLIQHILTEDIFSKVFGEDDFHRQNNVAKALYDLDATFFTGDLKKRTLRGLATYYAAIRSAADQISSHHDARQCAARYTARTSLAAELPRPRHPRRGRTGQDSHLHQRQSVALVG